MIFIIIGLDWNCFHSCFSVINILSILSFAGTEVGTVLTAVTANDVDTNPALTYSFGDTMGSDADDASQMDEDNAMNVFSIDRFSGKIILQKHLDFERRQEYQLKIIASDTSHVAHTTLTIRVTDINDNPPIFQQPAYHATLPGKYNGHLCQI